MPIRINCENRNKKRRINLVKIEKIARKVLRTLKKTNAEINIVFFSNQKIRAINRIFLGKDESTDVIAFPSDERLGPRRAFLGDIAISSDKAFQNAAEYGTAFVEEAALYVIHGILRLTGYDDRTKKHSRIMRRKEDELSKKTKALL